jgi:hypothetical protein
MKNVVCKLDEDWLHKDISAASAALRLIAKGCWTWLQDF